MNKLTVSLKSGLLSALVLAALTAKAQSVATTPPFPIKPIQESAQAPSLVESIATFDVMDDDNTSHSMDRNTFKIIERLELALDKYQQIHTRGGWPIIFSQGVLKVGDDSPAVVNLVKRLVISQDIASSSCSEQATLVLKTKNQSCQFDSDVEQAVKNFQKRHGLRADGVVGANTLKHLNMSVEQRIQQLELNLYRIMDFPGIEDDEYVYVNIPEYRLRYINDGKILLKNKVVVGKPKWATPSMSDKIEKFVVNPTWKIPLSIASKEIAPKVAEQPDYLEQKNIEIRKDSYVDDELVDPNSIDWDEITPWDFDYFLVEQASDKNPLGEVKYLFPNKDAIYVHDTPGKHWFDRTKRAASHGCIRMDNPFSLAEAFAKQNNRFDLLSSMQHVRESDETKTFYLENPIPIHLVYWTAWVDAKNNVNFRDDIYSRDTSEYFTYKKKQLDQRQVPASPATGAAPALTTL